MDDFMIPDLSALIHQGVQIGQQLLQLDKSCLSGKLILVSACMVVPLINTSHFSIVNFHSQISQVHAPAHQAEDAKDLAQADRAVFFFYTLIKRNGIKISRSAPGSRKQPQRPSHPKLNWPPHTQEGFADTCRHQCRLIFSDSIRSSLHCRGHFMKREL